MDVNKKLEGKLDYKILWKYRAHPILGKIFKELVKGSDMKQDAAFGWTQSDWAGNWTQSDWAGDWTASDWGGNSSS